MSRSQMKPWRRYQICGFVGLGLLVGLLGSWGSFASLQGAVIAHGVTVVESYAKRIQHRDGGIVTQILVGEGDRVKEGQVLLVLDTSDTRAELAILQSNLDEFGANRARLIAERDDKTEITFPDDLANRALDPRVSDLISGQRRTLLVQKAALDGRIEQLGERVTQIEEEISGLQAQYRSKTEQTGLVRQELEDLRKLLKQGLVQANRVFALDRERARLEGEEGELVASIAGARGRITETKLQIIQISDDARTKTLSDLREAEAGIAEVREKLNAAKARLERTDIRAPQSGTVHRLAVHTIGGVIAPGAEIMSIVPDADELVIDAHVRPEDIDQINLGQRAQIRFSSFDQRTTPEIFGAVIQIGADLVSTSENTPPYFAVRMRLDSDQLAALGTNKLRPGLPAEAFIQTQARTPLSYFLQPLTDQIAHTFRESS